jgi:hypothetical protein
MRGGTRQRSQCDFLLARSHVPESKVIVKSLTGITNEMRKVRVQPNRNSSDKGFYSDTCQIIMPRI